MPHGLQRRFLQSKPTPGSSAYRDHWLKDLGLLWFPVFVAVLIKANFYPTYEPDALRQRGPVPGRVVRPGRPAPPHAPPLQPRERPLGHQTGTETRPAFAQRRGLRRGMAER